MGEGFVCGLLFDNVWMVCFSGVVLMLILFVKGWFMVSIKKNVRFSVVVYIVISVI